MQRAEGNAPRGELPQAPGRPGRFGTAGNFEAVLGPRLDPNSPRGYYVDLRPKAASHRTPPEWFAPDSPRPHVVLIQWALGCWERRLAGGDPRWTAAAVWAADRLLEMQESEGPLEGGWAHRHPYKHTYRVDPPWLSGMAQGQGASLLVRVAHESGEERYADAARAALRPLGRTGPGGAAARLAGGRVPEEYPTAPPSHVLNGAIYGLWGIRDVAVGLGDAEAASLADEGFAALAESLYRFDTGGWSRYDLFPHPTANVASPMYHRLHVTQLTATAALGADRRYGETAERFAGYAGSMPRVAAAYARKAAFRLLVPRSARVARSLPWTRR